MSLVRRLAGQSAFFLVGNVFTLLVGFVFQVYLAKQLGAGGLGVYGLLESGVGVATALLSFGIAQTAMRFIPSHVQNGEVAEVNTLIRKGFLFLALSGLVGCLLVLLVLPLIKRQWPALQGYEFEIVVMSLMIPFGMITFFATQVLRGFLDVLHIVIGSSFLQLIVKVIVSVLMFRAGMHILGYIWAVVISTMFSLLWMTYGIKRHLTKYPQSGAAKSIMRHEWRGYARVMYSNSLLSFWFAPLDRFVLGYFWGVNAVGVLMIAKIVYVLPGVFLQMFLAIVAPMLSSAKASGKSDEVHRIYQLCTDWLVRTSFPLIAFMLIFTLPTLKIFGSDFASEGVTLLRFLLIAQLFSMLLGPIGSVLNMCGLEKKMFKISVINVMFSATILIVLVPLWGLNGIGASVLVGTIYANTAAFYVARGELGISWWNEKVKHWIIPSLFTIMFLMIATLKTSEYKVFELAVVLVIAYAIFFLIQFSVHGINSDDREVAGMIMKRLNLK